MKALVGAFNQEKALVGAFSVIVQPVVEHYTALDKIHTGMNIFIIIILAAVLWWRRVQETGTEKVSRRREV